MGFNVYKGLMLVELYGSIIWIDSVNIFLVKHFLLKYSKTCLKRLLLKRQKIGFQDQLLLNAGQKY